MHLGHDFDTISCPKLPSQKTHMAQTFQKHDIVCSRIMARFSNYAQLDVRLRFLSQLVFHGPNMRRFVLRVTCSNRLLVPRLATAAYVTQSFFPTSALDKNLLYNMCSSLMLHCIANMRTVERVQNTALLWS